MGFLGNLVLLVVWTAICIALVAGLERIFEAFGYRVTPLSEIPDTHAAAPLEK